MSSTAAEARLWHVLRNRQLDGAKFRRQHPVGACIADFCCVEARPIVELDGGQHTAPRDAARTASLEGAGFHVLRFWNNEVMENPDGVRLRIVEVLALTRPR